MLGVRQAGARAAKAKAGDPCRAREGNLNLFPSVRAQNPDGWNSEECRHSRKKEASPAAAALFRAVLPRCPAPRRGEARNCSGVLWAGALWKWVIALACLARGPFVLQILRALSHHPFRPCSRAASPPRLPSTTVVRSSLRGHFSFLGRSCCPWSVRFPPRLHGP